MARVEESGCGVCMTIMLYTVDQAVSVSGNGKCFTEVSSVDKSY